jgi:hypothetical protein
VDLNLKGRVAVAAGGANGAGREIAFHRDPSLMAFEGAQHLAGVEILQLRTSLYQEITDKIIADRDPLWRKRNLLDPAWAAGRSPCVSDRIAPGSASGRDAPLRSRRPACGGIHSSRAAAREERATGRAMPAARTGYCAGACASSRWSISSTCLAAWASSKLMPLQCRQVGNRRPLITVTCGMSGWSGSCVILHTPDCARSDPA